MRCFTDSMSKARYEEIKKKNVAPAKADKEGYRRSMDLDNGIDHQYQSGVTEPLRKPKSKTAPKLGNANGMLGRREARHAN